MTQGKSVRIVPFVYGRSDNGGTFSRAMSLIDLTIHVL